MPTQVVFPPGTSASEASDATKAFITDASTALPASFTAKYGITSVTATDVTPPPSSEDGSKTVAIAVGVSVGGVVLLAAVAAAIILIRRRQQKKVAPDVIRVQPR